MNKVLFAIAFGLSLATYGSCEAGPLTIDPISRQFKDESGRSVLLHGVNVVYKVDPYIPDVEKFDPELSLTEEDMDNLVKWGFNLVRLGVMWEAVERQPGVYDDAYLDRVDELITRMGKKGLYTMVDAHQDVLARKLCGEGIPDFYADYDLLEHSCEGKIVPEVLSLVGACKSIYDYGFRFDENGDPLIEDCLQNNFFIYYTSPESESLFNRLYQNVDGMRDMFLAYWDKVAQRLAANKYVIGYDPINEPFVSNYFTEPTLAIIPGKFDKEILQPLYKDSFEVYQKHDSTKMMFYETPQFPDCMGPLVFEAGFTESPGGADKSHLHVLNDHTYCCQMSPTVCAETGEPSLDNKYLCHNFHERRVSQRAEDAKNYGNALIFSEFGACMETEECAQEITLVTDVLDTHLGSWAYWQFKEFADLTTSAGYGSEGFYNKDGTLQDIKVKALARTYFPAAQGTIIQNQFHGETGKFQGQVQLDLSVGASTVLYANSEYVYPQGFSMSVMDEEGNSVEYALQQEGDYMTLTFGEDLNGKVITINIAKTSGEIQE